MKRLLPRTLLALLVSLALVAPTRAGLVTWDYGTTPGSTSVPADSGSSSISMAGDPLVHAAGSTDIVLTSLSALSTTTPPSTDTFTSKAWSVGLTITDVASHQSGTLTFTGVFNGTQSSQSTNISNTFTGSTTQTLVLGGNTYVVTANSYVPPSVPNALNTGAIGAHVDIRGGANGVPEPSSMLLCSFGAAGCALAGWRKRSRQRRAVSAA